MVHGTTDKIALTAIAAMVMILTTTEGIVALKLFPTSWSASVPRRCTGAMNGASPVDVDRETGIIN